MTKRGGDAGVLTEVQLQAVELLAQGLRHSEIGRRLGIRASLIGDWCQYDRDFRRAWHERLRGSPLPPQPAGDATAAAASPPTRAAAAEPDTPVQPETNQQPTPTPTAATEEQPPPQPQPLVTTRMAAFS